MKDNNLSLSHDDDSLAFKRRFKYGLIGLAVVEFLVFVFIFAYKFAR